MAAHPTPFTASGAIYTPPAGVNSIATLHGWSVRENGGPAAVATVLIRAGGASGTIVATIELAADKSETVSLDGGIQMRGGIYVEVAAGAVQGAVYHS